ncbi:MAG: LysR family transcriptional regulator [Beijerinckiaceae bacterium]
MNLLFLKTFVWVARAQNFTTGGKWLGISQQTASARVRSLERELGVRLIRHELRYFELTPEGIVAFEKAEIIIGQVAEFKEHMKELSRKAVPSNVN